MDAQRYPRSDGADVGRVLGIDAAGTHGWVGIVLDVGGFVSVRTGNLRELIDWAEPVALIGIDIPIGHVPAGSRRADVEARRFVGPRGSSVFGAPRLEALAGGSYRDANAELVAAGVPKMSRQAWALLPKMAEAADVAAHDHRVFEVHPEVSFCALGGEHLQWPKKSWNGLNERRRLLVDAGIDLPEQMADLGSVVADDVVDAAVVAWSARRIAAGTARTLPDPPEEHGGRKIAIWY